MFTFFCILFVTLLTRIAHDVIGAPLSTVDRLKIDHSLPDAFIEQENAKCNMSKLCTYEEMNVETICGTDGRTYNSICEIKRAICHGNPVEKKLEGPCPESLRCLLERSFQVSLAAENMNSSEIFIPECNATDGSYANVQCHKSTGYCWCVTRSGRPLPSTSVRHTRPNCLLVHSKINLSSKVERRSHHKNTQRQSAASDVCTTLDRSAFNMNLFRLFKNEYERTNDPQEDPTIPLERRIIMWKFGELDTNHDEVLSTAEMRSFRRLVRKLTQPKACARKFPRYCDLDKNKDISSDEWVTCLGVDLTTSYGLFNALRSNTSSTTRHQQHFSTTNHPSQNLSVKILGDLNMARMLSVPMTKARMEEALRNETVHDSDHSKSFNEAVVDDLNNEEEHVECRTQRAQAMKKLQMNPNSGNYVPTCTGENDLLYDRVQCHRSSQFCWCVNPETGAPIKGLSKYNGKPNCSRKSERRNREIKGCVGKKKMKFYQRLFTTLLSEWISAIGSDANEDTNVTKEQAVRWKFSRLDTNQNNRLERREWKPYREELKRWNKLHKCGRNFIRFCDSNGDKRLTMDEWINCTLSVDTSMLNTKPKHVLQRKNPFLDILRPED